MAETPRDPILDLSTQVEPTLTFLVDDEPYELRTVSHLSALEEAKLRRLIKREEQLDTRLTRMGEGVDDARLERIGDKIQALRVDLITMMTTLPEDKVRQLPPLAQQKLIRAIGKEASALREHGLDDEGAGEEE